MPIPSALSRVSPASAKTTSIAPAMSVPRIAVRRLTSGGSPCVRAAKIGAMPTGSTTTSRMISESTNSSGMAASHVKNKSNFTSWGGIFKTTQKKAATSGNRGRPAKKYRRPIQGHQGEVVAVRRHRTAVCPTEAITRVLSQKRTRGGIDLDQEDGGL